MFLDAFFQQQQSVITISPEQASRFAKSIANDFNPIHDPEHKRFCVPGDLLFALVLNQYGMHQQMQFSFEGMVGKSVELCFPSETNMPFTLRDVNDKHYLRVDADGEVLHDQQKIADFVRAYVRFSGLNFTDILVPLMQQHEIMINPARPLVIYEKMDFSLNDFNFSAINLALTSAALDVQGKRGDAVIKFALRDGEREIGSGSKTLVLSGLRAIEHDSIEQMLSLYNARKHSYDDQAA